MHLNYGSLRKIYEGTIYKIVGIGESTRVAAKNCCYSRPKEGKESRPQSGKKKLYRGHLKRNFEGYCQPEATFQG